MHHIYDRIFKKIITLSSNAVTNLINGLFETNYPPDSTISYNWTEFHDEELRRTLADTILTINGSRSYHMEAQMTTDDTIVLRVFDYSYRFAEREHDGNVLLFPEPKIIYFGDNKNIPDTETLTLDFGSQGTFIYKVDTFKYLEKSINEINQKKLIILIPFELLKLKQNLQKCTTAENIEALKTTFYNDIIESIRINYEYKNITKHDYDTLLKLAMMLVRHIYSASEYEEEVENMDQSIVFDFEILEQQIEEQDRKIREKEAIIEAKDKTLVEKEAIIEAKDNEIKRLKELLSNH